MAEPTPHATTAAHHAHAPTSSALYVRIAIILAIITAIEVAVSFLPGSGILGLIEVTVLLSLSIAKGVLIVMFFMHLKFDSRWFTALLVGGTVIATLFVLAFLALFNYKASLG